MGVLQPAMPSRAARRAALGLAELRELLDGVHRRGVVGPLCALEQVHGAPQVRLRALVFVQPPIGIPHGRPQLRLQERSARVVLADLAVRLIEHPQEPGHVQPLLT